MAKVAENVVNIGKKFQKTISEKISFLLYIGFCRKCFFDIANKKCQII